MINLENGWTLLNKLTLKNIFYKNVYGKCRNTVIYFAVTKKKVFI